MKFYAFFLLALAFISVNADHSETPSVSNIPSTTNTQSTTSTPVASATQGNTLINDGDWEQLAPFQMCSATAYASRAWYATYVYDIDQTFTITQHILHYHTKAQCLANGRAFLDVVLTGTGGPFGLVRANELYTLQRFEFTNVTIQYNDKAWRAVKILNDATVGCSCLNAAAGTAMDYEESLDDVWAGSCTAATCPMLVPWSLPHYNAYDVTSSDIISVSKMTEDVGEDFFSAEIGTVIKSPDTPSVTPTASMSPSTQASGTPSNSPLGPYQTSWIQVSPRLKCEESGDPHREEFNFYFKDHDGSETGEVMAYGNITGYPSKSACYSDWRRIYTVNAVGSGYCFIESANKEGYRPDKAYTLCSLRMKYMTFKAHRWRASKRWNDMVSGCRMGDDALPTGDLKVWQSFDWSDMSSNIADGTCEMFYKWNQQLFFAVHQRDHEGVNNHDGHRNAKISDFSLDWIDIDTKTSVAYAPMNRQNTVDGDFIDNYYDSIEAGNQFTNPNNAGDG